VQGRSALPVADRLYNCLRQFDLSVVPSAGKRVGLVRSRLRYAYFFGGQFDKSIKHARLVTDPFAADHAYFAAASAMTGDMEAARTGAAEVARLDPDWTVEKYLSDGGGYPEDVAMLFLDGARKAGVPACVPADRLSSLPNLVRLKTCDEASVRQTGGQWRSQAVYLLKPFRIAGPLA
jgi:hypothetical protein